MLQFHPSRFIWLLTLMLGIGMEGSQGQEYRYHYVPLHDLVPKGFTFDPVKITNGGRVYGSLGAIACDDWPIDPEDCRISIAVYEKRALTILQRGAAAFAATESGAVGGAVVEKIDPDNFPFIFYHAALFHGKKVDLIRRLPSEVSSVVRLLSDSGIAQVDSLGGNPSAYMLYPNGKIIPLDATFWGLVILPQINSRGVIAGTYLQYGSPQGDRAFLFNPRRGEQTLLNPLSPDTLSWGMDINTRGDVLGYSFAALGEPARIGVWSNQGQFETYFDENTAGFVSNVVCFNDNNLIVISGTEDKKIYLVPKPGVLLDLSNIVDHPPPGPETAYWTVIRDVNNHGDIVGEYAEKDTGLEKSFLLLRVDHRGD